jgi:hypothetical protein
VPILVVGGSTKDIGKTALVCAIISALRDYDWTAVKITAHDYVANIADQDSTSPAIREETARGEQTDTSRYLAAGARRALLVTRQDDGIPIDEMRRALGSDRNILFESNRIVDVIEPDVCLAIVVGPPANWKPSFVRLLQKADAVVSFEPVEVEAAMLQPEIPRFELHAADRPSPEMVDWLRSRLSPSQPRNR